MKIAFIGPKKALDSSGEIEKNIEEISIRLAEKGHSVFLYIDKNSEDDCRGVKIFHLANFFSILHSMFQSYDIIHYFEPNFIFLILKIFKRKTVIINTQCQNIFFGKNKEVFGETFSRLKNFVISNIPDKTIANSKRLGNYVWEKFKKRPIIIPNGIDIVPTKEAAELKKWNLQKGSYIIAKQKMAHLLIEAFKNLEDKHLSREKKLIILKQETTNEDYQKEIRDLSRGRENIIFINNQEEVTLNQLFSHAYFFVHPAESENLSVDFLEAMGYGKAILFGSSKKNEQFLNNEFSISFQSSDLRDLEEKLADLINDPVTIKKMGEKGMVKAQNEYNWNRIVDQLENVYKDILFNKRKKLIENYEGNI